MGSVYDRRNTENPQAGMLHQPTADELRQQRLQRALATNDQEWLAANYPGAWPWPVSGGVAKPASHQGVAKPEAQPFDADAHDAFMRGLG